jgi:hypothetical protein
MPFDFEPRPENDLKPCNAALSSFHTRTPEDTKLNNTGKIVGALAVALMVGAVGVVVYSTSNPEPKPKITAAQLPKAPPTQLAAATPPAPMADTAADAAMTPEPAAAPEPVKSEPVKSQAKAETPKAGVVKKSASVESKPVDVARNDVPDTMSARLKASGDQAMTDNKSAPLTATPEPSAVTPPVQDSQQPASDASQFAQNQPAPVQAAPAQVAPVQPQGTPNVTNDANAAAPAQQPMAQEPAPAQPAEQTGQPQ